MYFQNPCKIQENYYRYRGVHVIIKELFLLLRQLHRVLLSVVVLDTIDNKAYHADKPKPACGTKC